MSFLQRFQMDFFSLTIDKIPDCVVGGNQDQRTRMF